MGRGGDAVLVLQGTGMLGVPACTTAASRGDRERGGGTQLNVFLLQLSFKENLPFHSCLSKMSANAKCPEPHMLYTREAP